MDKGNRIFMIKGLNKLTRAFKFLNAYIFIIRSVEY